MANSTGRVILHLIVSTKDRVNLILHEYEQGLYTNLAKACNEQGCQVYRVGGTANHVHIACTLPRILPISQLLEEIKSSSAKWMKMQSPRCAHFGWQSGYVVFSIGYSQLDTLIKYIDTQNQHHESYTYEQEIRGLLKKYAVDFDERSLWQ